MRLINEDDIVNSTELASKFISLDRVPYIKVDDLMAFVRALPTACDPEEVIEKLEDVAYWTSGGSDEDYYEDDSVKVVDLESAIAIVRGEEEEDDH